MMISRLRFEIMLDLHKAVGYFVQHGESSNYTPFLQQRTFKDFHHGCDTDSPGVVLTTYPGSISLDTF